MDQFVISLGMFDGIHLGHRALIREAVREAKANHWIPVVFTYENHPKELFEGSFDYISTTTQREHIFRELGIERIDMVPFTMEFSQLSPEDFIEMLWKYYGQRIRLIVCGFDYRFGKGALGTPEMLQHLGQRYGFDVEVIPPVYYGNEPCSSSRVRNAVRMGDMHAAKDMLCRPFSLSGTVIHNKGIGTSLGFPTANMEAEHQLLPKDGVYATALAVDGNVFPSVTNIGNNPTVSGKYRTIETHLPGRNLDLYGKKITVLFLDRIRTEMRFETLEELKEQIQKDAIKSEKIFKENEKSVYNTENVW